MGLTVNFPTGVDEITVQGLTQWDKGQTIEIHCTTLPTVFQMHFACKNRTEAIVVSGTMSNNVGTVSIPDALLRQATDLKAWVYTIGENTGETVKTINLPITARAKPEDYITTLTPSQQTMLEELVASINDAISGIETEHTHPMSEITGLVDALAAKANTSHTHAQSNITGLSTALTTKEVKINKVTSLSASSTDTQYPSAKAVYNLIGDVSSVIRSINSIIGGAT